MPTWGILRTHARCPAAAPGSAGSAGSFGGPQRPLQQPQQRTSSLGGGSAVPQLAANGGPQPPTQQRMGPPMGSGSMPPASVPGAGGGFPPRPGGAMRPPFGAGKRAAVHRASASCVHGHEYLNVANTKHLAFGRQDNKYNCMLIAQGPHRQGRPWARPCQMAQGRRMARRQVLHPAHSDSLQVSIARVLSHPAHK